MQTFWAVVLGVVAGVVGFLPMFAGLRLSRRVGSSSVMSQFTPCLVGVVVSFLVLGGAAAVCVSVARPVSLPFVFAEAVTLCVVAIFYGVKKMLGK